MQDVRNFAGCQSSSYAGRLQDRYPNTEVHMHGHLIAGQTAALLLVLLFGLWVLVDTRRGQP